MHKIQEIIQKANFNDNMYGTLIKSATCYHSEGCIGKPKMTDTEIIVSSWSPINRVKFNDITENWEIDTEDVHELHFKAYGREYVIAWRRK